MKPKYKTALKIAGGLAVIVIIVMYFQRHSTKAYSPEDTVVYQDEQLQMEVFYNRPYRKEREIFGGLVPYGQVWRTGANEATTFTTTDDLLVDGSLLPAGKYTLWTIPGEESWKVIFNAKMYPWGIDNDKKPYRDPAFDALVLEVPTREPETELEQFTIYFERGNEFVLLNLAWDDTKVTVPLKPTKEAQSALL